MTQEKEAETMPGEAYSDEACRSRNMNTFKEWHNCVYWQVRSDFERHCSIHNINIGQLATMADVPLERLQAFYQSKPILSLKEWIKITDALGYKDYFTVGRKEKNRIIEKNSSLKILTELIKKADFEISLWEYAWMLDTICFGELSIILFPLIPRESAAELRKKRKPVRSESLRRYYESE